MNLPILCMTGLHTIVLCTMPLSPDKRTYLDVNKKAAFDGFKMNYASFTMLVYHYSSFGIYTNFIFTHDSIRYFYA